MAVSEGEGDLFCKCGGLAGVEEEPDKGYRVMCSRPGTCGKYTAWYASQAQALAAWGKK